MRRTLSKISQGADM